MAFADQPGTPAPILCEYCGEPRYTKGFLLFGSVMWMPCGPERCTCPEAVAAYEKAEAERKAKEDAERQAREAYELKVKIKRIIGESGMGERFLRRTFDTFKATGHNEKALRVARWYVEAFPSLMPKRSNQEPGRNCLFISGPTGTGKTHVAAAIANELIKTGTSVICMTMIDMLERIKRTFSKGDVDEDRVLRIYKTVPLLVIDDMGKEPPTEWAVSTVYNIINGRYEAYLPTVITTNYDSKTLIARMTPKDTRDASTAEATIDRLTEMCRSVTLSGPSWRSR